MSGLVVRVRRDAAPEVLRVSTVSSPAGAASGGLDGPAMGELTEGVRVVAIRRAGGPCYSTPPPDMTFAAGRGLPGRAGAMLRPDASPA